ncbi:MAG: beta-ketoacyl-ACP synthase II [candidate division Zixibacteria bacterium]|nr:beta-ketoacyl-ACP synthase II [candidate division Zixibacteria bacterium]
MSSRRVVITGMGIIAPLGLKVSEFWDNLLAGKSGVRPISRFDTSELPIRIAAEVEGFTPSEYFTDKEIRRIGLSHQYLLAAAQQAMEASGLLSFNFNSHRAGTIIGTCCGGISELIGQYDLSTRNGIKATSPFLTQLMFSNMYSCLIALKYKLQGLGYATASACASSAHAMGDSYRAIQRGEADIIVTGGTDAPIVPFAMAGFHRMKAMSRRNDTPEKASRPFDAERDGFVIAEGAGVLIFEELEHAIKRDAEILAEVAGYGMSCDAYSWTVPEPDGELAAVAIEEALRDAGTDPAQIDYINTHGTSTPQGDVAETKAIKNVFGEHAYKLTVNSTKSAIGHLLGAAAAVESIATIKTIHDGKIHPTINFENPDPDCDLDYSFNKVTEKEANIAVSNSLGFGGLNTALVIKKYKY